MTPERIKWLLRKAKVNNLNHWERNFISDLTKQAMKGIGISEKQASTLENIANKPHLAKRYPVKNKENENE